MSQAMQGSVFCSYCGGVPGSNADWCWRCRGGFDHTGASPGQIMPVTFEETLTPEERAERDLQRKARLEAEQRLYETQRQKQAELDRARQNALRERAEQERARKSEQERERRDAEQRVFAGLRDTLANDHLPANGSRVRHSLTSPPPVVTLEAKQERARKDAEERMQQERRLREVEERMRQKVEQDRQHKAEAERLQSLPASSEPVRPSEPSHTASVGVPPATVSHNGSPAGKSEPPIIDTVFLEAATAPPVPEPDENAQQAREEAERLAEAKRKAEEETARAQAEARARQEAEALKRLEAEKARQEVQRREQEEAVRMQLAEQQRRELEAEKARLAEAQRLLEEEKARQAAEEQRLAALRQETELRVEQDIQAQAERARALLEAETQQIQAEAQRLREEMHRQVEIERQARLEAEARLDAERKARLEAEQRLPAQEQQTNRESERARMENERQFRATQRQRRAEVNARPKAEPPSAAPEKEKAEAATPELTPEEQKKQQEEKAMAEKLRRKEEMRKRIIEEQKVLLAAQQAPIAVGRPALQEPHRSHKSPEMHRAQRAAMRRPSGKNDVGNKLIVGLTVISLLLLGYIFIRDQRQKSRDAATAEIIKNRSESETQEKKPVVSDASAKWERVKKVQGRASQTTSKFRIGGAKWRIKWSTKSGLVEGTFTLYIYREKGERIGEPLNVTGTDSGVLTFTEPGEYFLDIIAAEKYDIVVEQFQ